MITFQLPLRKKISKKLKYKENKMCLKEFKTKKV